MKDDVCIGNLCANMEFIGASHETSEPFGSFDFDGVLGLALSGMTQGRHFSIMDRMEAPMHWIHLDSLGATELTWVVCVAA